MIRNHKQRIFAFLLSLAIVLGMAPFAPIEVGAAPIKVTLSPENVTIDVRNSYILTAQFDGDITEEGVQIEWAYKRLPDDTTAVLTLTPSADKKTCLVFGNATGGATVTVTVTNKDGTESASCTVYVIEKVPVKTIVLNPPSTEMVVGDILTMTATIIPTEATDKGLTCTTSPESIVKIIKQELLYNEKNEHVGSLLTLEARAAGKATVNVYAMDKSEVTGSAEIIVTGKPIPPETIVMDESKKTVVLSTKKFKLGYTVLPGNTTNPAVTWTSSDREVATVNPLTGEITTHKVGTAVITATSVENTTISDFCELTVAVSAVPVQSIAFLQETASVVVKKTTPLLVKVEPVNASNKKLRLHSENPAIASVPATGTAGTNFNVTGVSVGTTKIYATSEESGDVVSCTVTVIPVPTDPVTGVTVTPKQSVLVVGGTVTPRAVITPSTATIKTLKWETDNDNIAGVEATGKVTAKTGGETIIRVRPDGATNDKGEPNKDVFAECKVHVLELNATELKLESGKTFDLKLSWLPKDQGYVTTWTTSKSSIANVSNKTSECTTAKPTPATTITTGASGEATITATVKSGNTTVATLKCVITVGAAEPDTIYYYIDGKANVPFNLADFNAVCTKMTGNQLDFIKFTTLPPVNEGTLYNLYDKTGEAKVNGVSYYYRSGTPTIANTSFVPASTFVGPTRIYYQATDVKGNTYESALIEIAVSDAAGDIQYSTAMNEPVTFSAKDFNEFCKKTSHGNQLNSVKFTLPNVKDGALYYMYNVDNAGKATGKKITATENYYYTNAPGLDDITFVPGKDFLGTVDIKFTGRDVSTNLVSGTVRVIVGRSASGSADIQYVVKKNEVCYLELDDFNAFCQKKLDSNLNYVQFLLPSEYKGTFYYNYTNDRNYDSLVTESRSYYRSSNPYLDEVAFVPAKDYEGRVSVRFTARTTSGQDISGTLAIFVGDGIGDIRYSAGVNVPIEFEANDFNAFAKGETGANLEYVQFNLPKNTEGEMFHRFGRSAESKVTAGTMYLRAGTPMLDEITFIPAEDFTGMIEFDFNGKTTDNKTITGTVVLVYDESITGGTSLVRYATEFRPVSFMSGDFERVCENRGDTALRSVQFTLPPNTVGRLYEGYRAPNDFDAAVDADTIYKTGSGAGTIGDITFVPRAGSTGSIAIPYKATDDKGGTYNGYIQVYVSPMVTSRFGDMYTSMWAIPSVEFLYEYGVVRGTGTNTYSPKANISRGDFMLMLYRAFDLQSADYGNFSDVPAGSYYAEAIAAARAVGIAQGDNNGLFHPRSPITRQDAMVLIHRTLAQTGHGVEDASDSLVTEFNDGGSVSAYARPSVAALIQERIIVGDSSHNLTPLNSVTRAEMAMIMHRVLTM